MIVDQDSYIQSNWLNGKGQTTQLLICPSGQDFKLQKFNYRISIASLSTEESSFSIFAGYNRWLALLHGGPVEVTNLTKNQKYELNPLGSVIFFDGKDEMQSVAKDGGKDFNFFLDKKYEGSMQISTLNQGQKLLFENGTHIFYVIRSQAHFLEEDIIKNECKQFLLKTKMLYVTHLNENNRLKMECKEEQLIVIHCLVNN